MKLLCLLSLLFLVSIIPATRVSEASKRTTWLTVSAGSFDRTESVVNFELPATAAKSGTFALKDRAGRVTSIQVDYKGQATFVLDKLKAGETKEYQLISASGRGTGDVRTVKNGGGLDLTLANNKAFSFVGTPGALPDPKIKPVFLRGGYIHPIYTPSGVLVSDDYPSDHYHHHGIWFAWTKTEFEGGHPDFWNVDDLTGRVDFESIGKTWSGAVHAGFTSRQDYVALTGSATKTALNEEWDVRLYKVGLGEQRFFLFDIVATQTCATSSPLVLDEYRYGGMGIRGNREWKDKSKVTFLTSEGKSRADGNATRGRWFRMSGPVGGKVVGIAVLDHPANFRAPQPMRLNPDDPFFNYGPSQMGKFEIKPGQEFVLRYRYIISDGPDDAAQLNRLWNDYANPPTVVVTTK